MFNLRISGLIRRGAAYFAKNIRQLLLDELRASCRARKRRPIFGAKLEAWRQNVSYFSLFTIWCGFGNCKYFAPINVKPAGRRRGIGRDFDIFPKIAVKFPTPGQECEAKYYWNFPPQEMICGQKFKYPYSRDRKIIQMPNPGFTGFSASLVYLHWPFRNSLGNWGEFQILTNR